MYDVRFLDIPVKNGATLSGAYFPARNSSASLTSSRVSGVMLLPGFTEHQDSLYDIATSISAKHDAWVFDLNGQGRSTGNWDVTEMGDSVAELSTYLKVNYHLDRLGLFGNALGAMAGAIAATKKGNSIDCLCLNSMPVSLQQFFPSILEPFKFVLPHSLVRSGAIALDKYAAKKFEGYRNRTHKRYARKDGTYPKHIQFGATKITNVYDTITTVADSPSMMDVLPSVMVPTLMTYGGENAFFGFKDSKTPEKYVKLLKQLGTKHKQMMVLNDLDHSLNLKTLPDDNFNQDADTSEKARIAREKILSFFNNEFS